MTTAPDTAASRLPGSTGRRVVVTGANGTVGRQLAGLLASQTPCQSVLLTRNPDSARLPGQPVQARFEDTRRLTEVFARADAVMIITNDPLRPDHDANIVTAAVAAGVRHLVKLSALAVADPRAQDLVTSWQRAAEERIRRCGIPWTILRPRAFMTHTLSWAPDIRRDATVRALYPDSRNACIAPRDIAEVALQVLLKDGHHGRTLALTGPRALSVRDQAAQLGTVLGRPLTCSALTITQARERWRLRYPEAMVHALTASAERQRTGAKEGTTRDVGDILGRPAVSFASWANEHARLFDTDE